LPPSATIRPTPKRFPHSRLTPTFSSSVLERLPSIFQGWRQTGCVVNSLQIQILNDKIQNKYSAQAGRINLRHYISWTRVLPSNAPFALTRPNILAREFTAPRRSTDDVVSS
jgi:hypothetical protein